jgi:hypothetical protein
MHVQTPGHFPVIFLNVNPLHRFPLLSSRAFCLFLVLFRQRRQFGDDPVCDGDSLLVSLAAPEVSLRLRKICMAVSVEVAADYEAFFRLVEGLQVFPSRPLFFRQRSGQITGKPVRNTYFGVSRTGSGGFE